VIPTVTVSVSPAEVNEGSSAIFTITSSAMSSQPLTVNYSMRGTAQLGKDYTLSGVAGQVVVPAGQSSATIVMQALADSVKERKETVILVLANGSGYTLPTRAKATATIRNGP
jgi:hypothetical protein